jgi:hypothetical protein
MIYDDGTVHMVGWLACPFPLRNDHFGLGGPGTIYTAPLPQHTASQR